MKSAANNIEKEEIGINASFYNSYMVDTDNTVLNTCRMDIEDADFVFIFIHGGLTQFKRFDSIMTEFKGKKRFFIWSGFEEENIIAQKQSGISKSEHLEISKYVLDANYDNCYNLFKYLGADYGKLDIEYKPPTPSQWEGIYYKGEVLTDTEVYIKKAQESKLPVVAVLFHSKNVNENNTKHIDEIINNIEKNNAFPFPVFISPVPNMSVGCRGLKWTIENILKTDGKNNINVIINTVGYSQSMLADPGDGTTQIERSIFEDIGVPVLQAMGTYQSYENWQESLRGIDAMTFPGSVYFPEFDGQIITTTVSYAKYVTDEIGDRIVFLPIPDRIDAVVRLAINWAKLSFINNKDKKIAILFHNMPPRNDMIGCAFGLDTPQSVYLMVEDLKKSGFQTEYEFEDGDDIIQRIIDGVSNDQRWLSADEALKRSIDIISKENYEEWFSNIAEKAQNELVRDWGDPPGDFMVHDGQLPVPGILNGNVFIGLQPSRGYEDKAEEIYHSTDIVCPHQYISFYKWLKFGFKADVVMHVGTHGTLEWLPGKEIGLSESCYPYITIDDIPHLYPYSITVEGEGIQAKRRSHAVLLDHLIPALIPSGSYGEMGEIDELLKQYYQAVSQDQGKVSIIEEQLKKLATENDFLTDLNITEEEMNADFEEFIEKLHSWTEEIKYTLIKDGLHIFGKAPVEDKLHSLICALTRIPNGSTPSLTQAMCKAMELDYDDLKDNPTKVNSGGLTNLMLFEEVEITSRNIVADFMESNYDFDGLPAIFDKYITASTKEKTEDLYTVLHFIVDTVIPKLEDTVDEMGNFIEGVNGNIVPPGASGAPTRGKVSILPTGRNFYSIDPSAVPTKAAWEVGKQLGDQLIERYVEDNDKYPEAIAIVIYSGETMKTCGDDVAQVLYLMGIKPRWLENSDKVVGFEKIPMDELKRPRIDVTLRVSGLFRDTFPNLMEYIEDVVNYVVTLDESEDENYIKRNFNQEVLELIENGVSVESAQEEAGMRIFSDPPGTYGAGVNMLIESKNWTDYTDLGDVYTFWGGYAYGKNFHGKQVTEVFARRLSKTQVTVKNESSMEIDMLESDDFYNYHGGLISAVRTHSGEKPTAFCGDTSDPSRVKTKKVEEQAAKIMRARILNPKWFDGLTEHGYKGAQEISGMVDFVFGWDATSDIIEDWMYEKISEHYLFNEERLNWINDVNPWAVQNITERLLEANQRGMWDAKDESIEKIKEIYMSVEGDIEEKI
jgi:cobaltochelatase CobN